MKKALLLTACAAALATPAIAEDKKQAAKPKPKKTPPTGYTDTPFLPGGKWRVHDDNRPRPEVVTPGKAYGNAPSDAIVLFDGTSFDNWEMQKGGAPVDWILKDGYMQVPPRGEGVGGFIQTKQEFSDYQLHIEWATPKEIESASQGRGNSGIFQIGQFELQVLDSYENKAYADGQASALYGYKPPLVNASRKPGEWQSYDIIFEAPKFDDEGKVTKKATITVLHNGVVTHHAAKFLGTASRSHKRVANYDDAKPTGPIRLQNHNNPVRFRNIWLRPLDLTANE